MNIFAIAAKAEADHKTVRKWLDLEKRKTMKPAVARRVAKAGAELGYSETLSNPLKVASCAHTNAKKPREPYQGRARPIARTEKRNAGRSYQPPAETQALRG